MPPTRGAQNARVPPKSSKRGPYYKPIIWLPIFLLYYGWLVVNENPLTSNVPVGSSSVPDSDESAPSLANAGKNGASTPDTPVVVPADGKKDDLTQTLYGPVKNDMKEVELILLQEFSSKQELLGKMLKHGLGMGGKRLRPALTLLSGRLCGALTSRHFTCGAIMELIHLATLVHDDILDEADLRRHRETMNARWSNELAVLFGDLLLARSICLASQLNDFAAFELISQTSRRLCEGEILQVANRGNYNLTPQTYYDIIEGKTAALLECSCRLGAMASNAPEATVQKIGAFGRNLGMAFQIIDDVLDLSGSEEEAGKTLGQDLKKEKPTLSVIFAMECVSPEKKCQLIDQLKSASDPAAVLRPWLERTSALDFAKKKAQNHVNDALKCLDEIPDQGLIQQPFRESLRNIANFVLSRNY